MRQPRWVQVCGWALLGILMPTAVTPVDACCRQRVSEMLARAVLGAETSELVSPGSDLSPDNVPETNIPACCRAAHTSPIDDEDPVVLEDRRACEVGSRVPASSRARCPHCQRDRDELRDRVELRDRDELRAACCCQGLASVPRTNGSSGCRCSIPQPAAPATRPVAREVSPFSFTLPTRVWPTRLTASIASPIPDSSSCETRPRVRVQAVLCVWRQ